MLHVFDTTWYHKREKLRLGNILLVNYRKRTHETLTAKKYC